MDIEEYLKMIGRMSFKEPFPLLDVPDLVFEEIVKYLDPATLLKLQSTCKIMQMKCYRAQRLVTYNARCFRYLNCYTITLCGKNKRGCGNAFPFHHFAATRFRLNVDLINIPQKVIEDIHLEHIMKLLSYRRCKAKMLKIETCNANPDTLNTFLKKFNITSIDADDPSSFVQNISIIPAMKQITDFVTYGYAEYTEEFFRNTNFSVLKIRNTKPLSLNILRILINDLLDGRRNISWWYLYDGFKNDLDLEEVFKEYTIVPFRTPWAKLSSRPMAVKFSETDYKIICKNDAQYRISTIGHIMTPYIIGLQIRKC